MKYNLLALSIFSLMTSPPVYSDQRHYNNLHDPELIYLDQHWTEAERDKFYYTPQGSYLLPYAWFQALQAADGRRPFKQPRNIRSYGYLVDEHNYSLANPDGLPVGFAKEPLENGETWLGYSCAACHTNDIQYQGQTIRVDGAPTLADFTAFNDGLIAALESTLHHKNRFERFARAVLGRNADKAKQKALRVQVSDQNTWLKDFAKRNKPSHAYGAGRVDAFGVIMNEVFNHDLDLPENNREPSAPVSYPFLWSTPQHDFVQWNGSAFNPFGRNVGEVLGTFGRVNLDVTSPDFGSTSARAWELFELERLVAKLGKPNWPEALFGVIDQNRASRGQLLYNQSRNGEESCADCHALPDSNGLYPSTPAAENRFGAVFVKTHMTPLADIGTDPLTATNFALRSVKTGAVAPLLPAPFTNASELPAPALLSILVSLAAKDSSQKAQPAFDALESAELIGYRQKAAGLPAYTPPNLLAYRARPLDGIWASAPYLHNGSVPSLYELLLPPAQRSQVFYVGNREFDPDTIGFKSTPSRNGFRLDTRLPGNANSGHTYGTELSDAQRLDLLEFLKTL